MGIGLICGPIIGSSVYTAVGFKWTFVILGAALLPLACLFNCLLLRKLREVKGTSEKKEQLDDNEECLLLSEKEEIHVSD